VTEKIAKVEDLDAIKSLKRALWKFAETANVALSDAEGEMTRALMWLEGEQRAYWEGQLRKRADHVERCKEAVRMKKLFKDASGRTPSAVDEEKALRLAIRRFEEAEVKRANVKKHTQTLRKEILMYKGHVQRFATSVQNELPMASAQLDSLLEKLQRYISLEAPVEVPSAAASAAGPEVATEQVGGGMSRGDSTAGPEVQPPAAPPGSPEQAPAPAARGEESNPENPAAESPTEHPPQA
jgi:hypothetical protein